MRDYVAVLLIKDQWYRYYHDSYGAACSYVRYMLNTKSAITGYVEYAPTNDLYHR